MEYLMNVEGKRVILNAQYSKICNCYPRLFVEASDEMYINIDVTIGASFKMKAKDFQDWLQDAQEVKAEDQRKMLEDYNINYDVFVQVIQDIIGSQPTAKGECI